MVDSTGGAAEFAMVGQSQYYGYQLPAMVTAVRPSRAGITTMTHTAGEITTIILK